MSRRARDFTQTVFNKGEISPEIYGRYDVDVLYKGVREATNVRALVAGPLVKCPGTKYLAAALSQYRPSRLVAFEFSNTESYMLEFGEYVMRIFFRGDIVLNPYTGEPAIIDTPYNLSDLQPSPEELDNGAQAAVFMQDKDTFIIAHGNHPPRELKRYDHHDWRFSFLEKPAEIGTPQHVVITTDGGNNESYIVTATNGDVEGYPSAEAVTTADDGDGVTTLSWDEVEGATGYNIYKEFEQDDEDGGFIYKKIGSIDTTTYTDNAATSGSGEPPSPESVFFSSGLYPQCGAFDRERLWLASPRDEPNRLYGSELAAYRSFVLDIDASRGDEEVDAADAADWPVATGSRTPDIMFLCGVTGGLLVGSTVGEYLMKGEEPAINPGLEYRMSLGCSSLQPVQHDNAVFYANPSRESLIVWGYNEIDGDYRASEASLRSSHLFSGHKIMGLASDYDPDYALHCILDTGEDIQVMYQAEERAIGFTRRITDGAFEACVDVLTPNGSSDVYLQTRREINGETVRYIEMQMKRDRKINIDTTWYVDCGKRVIGDSLTEVTGLEHLEGKRVSILADGAVIGVGSLPVYVTDGKVTLPNGMYANNILVGLPYTARVTTRDFGPPGEPIEIRNRQGIFTSVQFYNSADCLISVEDSPEEDFVILDSDGQTTKIRTSFWRTTHTPACPDGSLSSSVTLSSNTPLPWGISCVSQHVAISEQHNGAHLD